MVRARNGSGWCKWTPLLDKQCDGDKGEWVHSLTRLECTIKVSWLFPDEFDKQVIDLSAHIHFHPNLGHICRCKATRQRRCHPGRFSRRWNWSFQERSSLSGVNRWWKLALTGKSLTQTAGWTRCPSDVYTYLSFLTLPRQNIILHPETHNHELNWSLGVFRALTSRRLSRDQALTSGSVFLVSADHNTC